MVWSQTFYRPTGSFFYFCLSPVCQFSLCTYIISKSTFFTDQLQPEVIQRRSSITAPMSPRSSTTATIITIIYSTIVTTTNSPSRSSQSSTTSTSIKTIVISIITNRASLPQFCFIWLMFWDRINLLLCVHISKNDSIKGPCPLAERGNRGVKQGGKINIQIIQEFYMFIIKVIYFDA